MYHPLTRQWAYYLLAAIAVAYTVHFIQTSRYERTYTPRNIFDLYSRQKASGFQRQGAQNLTRTGYDGRKTRTGRSR